MALTTIALVQAYDTTNTTASGTIQWAIDAVSAEIETYCDRTFAATSYTEKYSGGGRFKLVLNNMPVSGVASVTIEGTAADGWELDEFDMLWLTDSTGEDYLPWPYGVRNISVTYTAGFTTTPKDIEMVATQMVLDVLNQTDSHPGIKSQTLGDRTTVYDLSLVLEPYKPTLDKYRRITI